MKILGEKEEKVLFKTILFDNKEEKEKISKKMELDDWQDIQNGKGTLRVVFRKYAKIK